MKLFYPLAILIVAVMVASPLWLLRGEETPTPPPRKKTPVHASDDPEPTENVVLYDVYGSKVNSIDPATCGDTTSSGIQGNFYEGLYTYHFLKRPVEVVPLLASTLPKISADGRTYTIRLKKDVTYSRNPCFGFEADGKTPKTRTIRAADFVLAFKRVADKHVSTKLSYAFLAGRIKGLTEYREATEAYVEGDFSRYDKLPIEGVQALDEHTLQIQLLEPFPQLLYVLAMHVYAPIPREMIDYHLTTQLDRDNKIVRVPMGQRDAEIRRKEAVVGTGPYLLTEWVEGGKITMVRNPDFRDDYYPTEGAPGDREAGLLADAGKKVPFIDERRLTFVAETNPAWMLFENKRRDVAGIPRDMFDKVISPDRDLVEKWTQQGVTLIKYTSPSVYWLAFNYDDAILGSSKSLRQALCLSYDVESHIKVLFNGRGSRAVNTLPRSVKGWKEAGIGPYYRYDLKAAKEKIKQAKKELVEAGFIKRGEDIPELTIELGSKGESARRMGEFVMGQFRKIGIRVKVEPNDWPTLQEKVHNKLAQIYMMGWHADYPDPENFLQLYYTPNIDKGTNNTNYSNPKFDKLFKEASVTLDEQKRFALNIQMLKILNEDCPVLLLSEPTNFILKHKWVYNIKPHPVGYGMSKYRRIDVEERVRMGGRKVDVSLYPSTSVPVHLDHSWGDDHHLPAVSRGRWGYRRLFQGRQGDRGGQGCLEAQTRIRSPRNSERAQSPSPPRPNERSWRPDLPKTGRTAVLSTSLLSPSNRAMDKSVVGATFWGWTKRRASTHSPPPRIRPCWPNVSNLGVRRILRPRPNGSR